MLMSAYRGGSFAGFLLDAHAQIRLLTKLKIDSFARAGNCAGLFVVVLYLYRRNARVFHAASRLALPARLATAR
jgi:hypothetical protein